MTDFMDYIKDYQKGSTHHVSLPKKVLLLYESNTEKYLFCELEKAVTKQIWGNMFHKNF